MKCELCFKGMSQNRPLLTTYRVKQIYKFFRLVQERLLLVNYLKVSVSYFPLLAHLRAIVTDHCLVSVGEQLLKKSAPLKPVNRFQ